MSGGSFGWKEKGETIASGFLQLQGGVPLDSTLRRVTDKLGTASPLQLSTTQVNIDTTSSGANGGYWANYGGYFDQFRYGNTVRFRGYHAAGTFAAPTATTNGTTILILNAGAYNGTSFIDNGRIEFLANELQAVGSAGSRLRVRGMLNTTATFVDIWQWYGTGSGYNEFVHSTIIGSTGVPSARLHVRGDGTNPIQRWENGAGSAVASITNAGLLSAIGADFGGSLSITGSYYFHVDIDPNLTPTANGQIIALQRFRHRGTDGAFTGVLRPLFVSENGPGGQHQIQLFESGLRIGFSTIANPTALFEGKATSTEDLIDLKTSLSNQAFLVKENGNILAPLIATSRPATVGELYQDTAANILANGDKVIGIRQ